MRRSTLVFALVALAIMLLSLSRTTSLHRTASGYASMAADAAVVVALEAYGAASAATEAASSALGFEPEPREDPNAMALAGFRANPRVRSPAAL